MVRPIYRCRGIFFPFPRTRFRADHSPVMREAIVISAAVVCSRLFVFIFACCILLPVSVSH